VRDFARRAAFAVVAIPAAGAILWFGGLVLALVLALIAALGAWEFYRLAAAGGVRALDRAGIVLAAAIPLVVHTNYAGITAVPMSAGALALIAVFAAALWLRLGERPLSAVSATVFGVLYSGGLVSFVYTIRYHPYAIGAAAGTALVGLPLVLTWATDTGGYIFGRMFGRSKLMAAVSPGKTWIGAAGGLLLAVTVVGVYVAFVLNPVAHLTMTPVGIAVFGTLASVSGQIGDLAESMLKREAGVKDSSHLIPGHGGVLDRLDGMFFVLPVAFVLMTELLKASP
jgi:phosphatidate cytidylyltransferase